MEIINTVKPKCAKSRVKCPRPLFSGNDVQRNAFLSLPGNTPKITFYFLNPYPFASMTPRVMEANPTVLHLGLPDRKKQHELQNRSPANRARHQGGGAFNMYKIASAFVQMSQQFKLALATHWWLSQALNCNLLLRRLVALPPVPSRATFRWAVVSFPFVNFDIGVKGHLSSRITVSITPIA